MENIDRHKLYQDFQTAFPLESLQNMPLEKYTNTNKDSFCYWLEFRTLELGSIKGSTSYKFGIYNRSGEFKENKKYLHDDRYAWYASFGSTAAEAYQKVLNNIIKIAQLAREHNFEAIDNIQNFSEIVKWKIAFLYSEESLVCFYKREMLEKIAKDQGMEVQDKTISAMQRYILNHKGDKDIYTYYDELLSTIVQDNEVIWLWKGDKNTFRQNVLQMGSSAPTLDFDAFPTEYKLKAAYQAIVKNKDTNIPKAYWRFLHEVNKGDLVVVFSSRKTEEGKQHSELYGWGRISSDYSIHPEEENPIWRTVDWHLPCLNSPVENRDLKGSLFMQKVDKQKTVTIIKKQLGIELSKKTEVSSMTNKYQKYIDLLKANRNIVLTGAPGTGKTFIAKAIAAEMGAEVGFVQFHPSYDYTDFVEGLRPTHKNGSIGFERKDGVFKAFCESALINYRDSQKSTKELNTEQEAKDKLDKFINNATEKGEDAGLSTSARNNPFVITEQENDKIHIRVPQNEIAKEISVSRQELIFVLQDKSAHITKVKDYVNYLYKKGVRKTKNYKQEDSYAYVIYENVKKEKVTISLEVKTIVCKPFVFIIDEINRGEISKIFGELFFSIDPGYRGEKGRVNTQYQNLIEDGDTFAKGFFVPENIYIIGTMNDIDRSVESMDFAMRRRFAWVEVKPEDSLEMLDTLNCAEEAKTRMVNLNHAILKIQGLNEAYQIGAAYFKKMEQYNHFDQLWENHIKGLLREYLRGIRNGEEDLKFLHEAFNDTKDHNTKEESSATEETTEAPIAKLQE